ncbi:hypothetical protein [Nocardioides sp. Iso805N]|uniref:hypothetical protein n=1 Tax=Nocardioides sp. Iso805N TaxID=1283287 RepID=UPI000362AAD8|nr:hypothetical protein [Nocardioides sp. Iso805N]
MPRLSKLEIRKDVLQSAVEAMASTVGEVTSIVTGAVRDVAASVGGLATELFELRDSAQRAAEDGADPDDASD